MDYMDPDKKNVYREQTSIVRNSVRPLDLETPQGVLLLIFFLVLFMLVVFITNFVLAMEIRNEIRDIQQSYQKIVTW